MKSRSYVINLDRVPERYAFVQREFERAGLEVARWPAVDAAVLVAEDHPQYRPGSGTRWTLTPTLIACFESHRRIWQQAVDHQLDMTVIFEDDVFLTPEAGEFFDRLFSQAPEFDILKLDTTFQRRRFGRKAACLPGYNTRQMAQTVASAAAYAISFEGARKLLEASRTYCDHLDDFVFAPRSGWKTHQLVPAIACQGMFLPGDQAISTPDLVATSERTSDQALNKPQSFPPLSFRIRKSFIRELGNLHWMLWGKRHFMNTGGFVGTIELSSPIKAN